MPISGRIKFGSSFVTSSGYMTSYSGPIAPPIPPVEKFFQFTNTGHSLCKIEVYSTTKGKYWVNDEFIGAIQATTTNPTVIEIPAGGTVKLSEITPANLAERPLFGDVDGYTGSLTLERFDESCRNYEFALSSWAEPFTSLKKISTWEGASSITAFKDTFNSSGLTSIPSSWEGLDSITSLWGAFNSCSNLKAIPDSWEGLENLTTLYCAFKDNTDLVNGGSAGFEALSKIDNMWHAFNGCTSWVGDAKAMYDYLSSKVIEVPTHQNTFTGCTNSIGWNEIPDTWGGGLNYNPLNLPAYTIRLKYTDGVTPSFSKGTATQVSSSPNVWDLTYNNSNWNSLLNGHTDLIEVLGANTENITSMNFAFQNCSNLKEVQLFDIGRIGSLRGTFLHCTSLTAVPKFDTRNLYSFESTFSGCSSLTTVPLFDTSNVTNMSEMFRECTSLINVPLFDTKNVREMISTFYECSSLTTIPLFDTRSLTTLFCTFSNCSSLVSIPLLNTSNVHEFTGAFGACTSLITVPLFDTHNAITFNTMFIGCTNLTSIPVFDSSKVTDMDWMFCGCSSLKEVPLLDTGKVTTIDLMFKDCVNVEHGALVLYNQVSSQMNPPSNHSMTFFNCGSNTQTGAAELAQIPSGWK